VFTSIPQYENINIYENMHFDLNQLSSTINCEYKMKRNFSPEKPLVWHYRGSNPRFTTLDRSYGINVEYNESDHHLFFFDNGEHVCTCLKFV
jgi:hypothetical protein